MEKKLEDYTKFMYTEELYYQEYQFIKIPKILVESDFYKNLSLGAKMLYSIMANRQNLSLKNKDKFVDDNGNIFLIYTIEDLRIILNISKKTIIKYKKELVKFNLLFEKRLGLGKPNRLYILRPNYKEKAKNTRNEKNSFPEVENLLTTITDEQEQKDIEKEKDLEKEYKKYKELILKNLKYSLLEKSLSKFELDEINQIIELMLDVIVFSNEKIIISGRNISKKLVVDRFLKLNYDNIIYVLSSIKENSKETKNIRNYLITCLYNSYTTFSSKIYNSISDNF